MVYFFLDYSFSGRRWRDGEDCRQRWGHYELWGYGDERLNLGEKDLLGRDEDYDECADRRVGSVRMRDEEKGEAKQKSFRGSEGPEKDEIKSGRSRGGGRLPRWRVGRNATEYLGNSGREQAKRDVPADDIHA